MALNNNITITQIGDKFGFLIKDIAKEVVKTQKTITKLTTEHDKTLLKFWKARESFYNKFVDTTITEDIAINSKEFQTMKELAENEKDISSMIKWETAYLKRLQNNMK